MKIKLLLLISLLATPSLAQDGSINLYQSINSAILCPSIVFPKAATIPDNYAKSCFHRVIQRKNSTSLYQNFCKLCFENEVCAPSVAFKNIGATTLEDLMRKNKKNIHNIHCFQPRHRANSWLDVLEMARKRDMHSGISHKYWCPHGGNLPHNDNIKKIK